MIDVNTIEYLKRAHAVDEARGGHCRYAHKWTEEECLEAIKLVAKPSEKVIPKLCEICSYYHMLKLPA